MPLAGDLPGLQFDEAGKDWAADGVFWPFLPFVYVLRSPFSVQRPVAYCWNDDVEPFSTKIPGG